MRYLRLYSLFSAFAVIVMFPLLVQSQAIMVLDSGENARQCFFSAKMASELQSASSSEVESCTLALEHASLKPRGRAATYVNRGVIHAAAENYRQAARDYRSAMSLHPDFGAIYVNRGNLFFLAQSFDRAVDEYTRALTLDLAAKHIAHLNRGMAYEHLGEFTNAETDYRRALELAPEWKMATAKLERVLKKIK